MSMLLEIIGMQLAASITSSIVGMGDEKKRDQNICNQLTNTKASLDKINTLLEKVGSTQDLQKITSEKINDLVDTVNQQKKNLQNSKKTFRTKLLISIIINIVITAIVAINLLM